MIEIVPKEQAFFDYEAKYTRDDTQYILRPDLPSGVTEALQRRSEQLAAVMNVRHVARVDYILDASGDAWMLELNTMPGFTSRSMFPMMWAATGLPYPDLCHELVELALS